MVYLNKITSFTYTGYKHMVELLLENDYVPSTYDNYNRHQNAVILRHDIDTSLQKAYRIAELENQISEVLGVKIISTFFFLLSTDFYNVFSFNSQKVIDYILSHGHEIGLHFDELRYPDCVGKSKEIIDRIQFESNVLSKAIGHAVTKVSMHRPSKKIINSNISIPGIINTYSDEYFVKCKYLSDSRHCWREPVEDIIKSKQFRYLHILTHPFWYNENEQSVTDTVRQFVLSATRERYIFNIILTPN